MIFEFLICIMHDSFSFCRLCIHLCPWCAYIFAFLPFLSSQPDLRYLTIPISPGPPWCGKGPLSSLFFCNLPLHGKGISNAVHNNQRPLKFADFLHACSISSHPPYGEAATVTTSFTYFLHFPGTVVPVSGWVSPQSAACPRREQESAGL